MKIGKLHSRICNLECQTTQNLKQQVSLYGGSHTPLAPDLIVVCCCCAAVDANDAAQFAELKTQGELTRRAWEKHVQVGTWHTALCRAKPKKHVMPLHTQECASRQSIP